MDLRRPDESRRIDSSDRLRVGGPGPLPEWPLCIGAPSEIRPQLGEALMALATNILAGYGVDYEQILLVKRYSRSQIPTVQDNTLYIVTSPLLEDTGSLILVADDTIAGAQRLGFTGRVEILDSRATGGLKSYPPRICEQFKQSWATIKSEIIARLTALNIDWQLIHLARRGYWEAAADETVVINATVSSRSLAITLSDTLTRVVEGYGIKAEICRSDLLWGVFSTKTEPVDRGTLGWPFTRGFHSMGLSTGRSDGGPTGTLGGYLAARDGNGHECVLGLTCYHILREGRQGLIDYHVQANGSNNLNIPFSSPSPADIETAKQQTQQLTSNIPENVQSLPSFLRGEVRAQEANKARRLEDINSYNPNIGTAIATSGWGDINTPLDSSFHSPLILQDWAVIHMADNQQIANYTGDFNLPASVWNYTGGQASKIVPFHQAAGFESIQVVKRGRSTGATSGVLTTICPASLRLADNSSNIFHHGAWVVTNPSGFAAPGDSGAWVLDNAGQVVGFLIGGDWAQGLGLVLPMSLVIEDIEKRMGIPKGGVKLYMAEA